MPHLVRTSFAMIFMLALSHVAWADGIDFTEDKKGLEEEHITFKLTPEQVIQVERFREIMLTPEQQAEIKKYHPNAPKCLGVLTSHYSLCTCELEMVAVWCRPGEVGIPTSLIRDRRDVYGHITDTSEDSPEKMPETATAIPKKLVDGTDIIFDSAGKMYYEGLEISSKDLTDRIARGLKKSEYSRHGVAKRIVLNAPPPINADVDKKVGETIQAIRDACKKKKINCFADGFEDPEE